LHLLSTKATRYYDKTAINQHEFKHLNLKYKLIYYYIINIASFLPESDEVLVSVEVATPISTIEENTTIHFHFIIFNHRRTQVVEKIFCLPIMEKSPPESLPWRNHRWANYTDGLGCGTHMSSVP
jgi:hypothetical protein